MPMAAHVAIRHSIWPLAGYALLAVIAFAKGPARSRSSYPYLVRSSPRLDEAEADAERQGRPPDDREPAGDASWWSLVRNAGMQWVGHKDARLGAALAYYSVFSIGPLILIAVAVAGLLFGQDAVRGEVSNSLKGLLGDTGAQAINGMLAAASKPREGILATVIGIGTLIFAAIGVVVQLKDALNTVWEVKTPPGRGIWGFARAYVLSFAGVLALGFLLLISMLLTAALAAAGKFLSPYLPEAALLIIS